MNMDLDSERTPKRGKKACTQCRQQKAKCDAYLSSDQPCSRCARMKTQCVISDPFRREHKRQRLSELENETDQLRQKLRSSQSAQPQSSPIAMLTAAAEMEAHGTGNRAGAHPTPQSQSPASAYTQPVSPHPPGLVGPSLSTTEIAPMERNSGASEPRSLNNVHLSRVEIDELFHLFFAEYAPFLPILDPRTGPDSYYAQSPFLFWAVIGVASRTYSRNPTLLSALGQSISEMAMVSIASTTPQWHIIQGFLLILAWPFPKGNTKPDITFVLGGMLLHMAMQNGLHIPMSSHEFAKIKIPTPSEADLARRSELWAHCVISYQQSCNKKGLPPRPLSDLEPDTGQRQILFRKISPALVLHVKAHDLITRCSTAMTEFGIRVMSREQEKGLDVLLRSLESQVSGLEAEVDSDEQRFHITICRLNIQVYKFFKTHYPVSGDCLCRIAATSCAIVDYLQALRQRLSSLGTLPAQMLFGLMLASTSLLRILKGPAASGLDIEKAKASFFTAINLSRQMSVDPHDAAGMLATILGQLWNSTRVFRKSDSGEYTALRIRSRLAASIVIDVVWWWREEFDLQCRQTVSLQGTTSDGTTYNRDGLGTVTNAPSGVVERQDPIHFDDQFIADFEWALGDDGLFPSTEPFELTWPSTGTV